MMLAELTGSMSMLGVGLVGLGGALGVGLAPAIVQHEPSAGHDHT